MEAKKYCAGMGKDVCESVPRAVSYVRKKIEALGKVLLRAMTNCKDLVRMTAGKGWCACSPKLMHLRKYDWTNTFVQMLEQVRRRLW